MFDAELPGMHRYVMFLFESSDNSTQQICQIISVQLIFEEVYRALCKADGRVYISVLPGKGSNSLTIVSISRVLRGLGISPRKIGVKESGLGLVPGFSTFCFSPQPRLIQW